MLFGPLRRMWNCVLQAKKNVCYQRNTWNQQNFRTFFSFYSFIQKLLAFDISWSFWKNIKFEKIEANPQLRLSNSFWDTMLDKFTSFSEMLKFWVFLTFSAEYRHNRSCLEKNYEKLSFSTFKYLSRKRKTGSVNLIVLL